MAATPAPQPIRRTSTSTVDALLGTVLDGDFEVVRSIGAGSHAEVYQARQRSVGNRTVALKVLSRHYLSLSEADFRRAGQMLQREAELLGAMHAACFVDVYRTGLLPDGRPYLAMEHAEGQTLAQLCAAQERVPLDQALDLLHQWADGLCELHARGCVHRDVTPANVMVTQTVFGTQRILGYDFGTVSPITQRADRFRVGYDRDRPVGTPAYMSPEQAAGGVVDGRADQFALAAVAFEMLAGKRPVLVDAKGAGPLLDYLRGSQPIPTTPFGQLRPDLPPAAERVLHKALDRQPEKRFADVRTFVVALEQALHGAVDPEPRRAGLFSRLFGGSR